MPEIQLARGRGKAWYAGRCVSSPYPPLLLMHGAAGTHLDWPAELRRLPEATVFVPDLPGHGRSPGPGRQSIAEYAADMLALLDALDVERAVVGGHSMGSAIAQQMALDDPARVAGLILIGSGAKLRVHPDILGNILASPEQVYDLITTWGWAEGTLEMVVSAGRKLLSANDPQVVYGDYAACNAFDVMARLDQIAAPTLIFSGTADRMTPFKYGAYLAEHIPNTELVTVEGGGHMMALEQPGFVAGVIAGWLKRMFRLC